VLQNRFPFGSASSNKIASALAQSAMKLLPLILKVEEADYG
jgi:hypothetical protein